MKKTISIITTLIMILCIAPISLSAYYYTYKCKDYSIYMLEEDSQYGDCKLDNYNGSDIDVEIPTKIYHDELNYGIPRKIGMQCFSACDFIESVTIPETIEYIGAKAFEYCSSLKKITIPPSVKTMKDDIFYHCNIDNLTIYGYTNSIAERYAKEYNIQFKSIGVVPTEPTTKKPVNTVKTTAPTKPTNPVVKTKKATIKKLTPKKKALKLTWKKVSGAKGYEIKLATNKKFTKNKKTVKVKKGSATSKTIKKLKSGKKYFVKIRAYKKVTIDGYTVTANGPWSKVKSKKVK